MLIGFLGIGNEATKAKLSSFLEVLMERISYENFSVESNFLENLSLVLRKISFLLFFQEERRL